LQVTQQRPAIGRLFRQFMAGPGRPAG